MTVKNDASLRGKSKALAQKYGLSAQEVTQMYLFERFLARLSTSDHKENFVIKGGFLIASQLGVANRTTMDLDTTLRAMKLDEETVAKTVGEICAMDCDDDVVFFFEYAEPIRDDDDYGGYRAHIRAHFRRMDTPMKIDITTGDIITPAPVMRSFPMIFDEDTIDALSYPDETNLAEKFEAVVKRGVTTSRARDLYDAAMLLRLYREIIDWEQAAIAIRDTSKHRGTWALMTSYETVCDEMAESEEVKSMWGNYVRSHVYAQSVTLEEALDAIREIGRRCLDGLQR